MPTVSRCSSPTGSAATRTCGASWRRGSRTSSGWCCSTTRARGHASADAYDVERHGTLDGYADDVLEICAALDLHDVVFVGHSVSAMIGVLASLREPERFSKLVLVGPSPRYIDDDGYVGGFTAQDIDELLDSLESNYLGWSSAMAPVIMGNPDRPELGAELTDSFCRTDPEIARRFAARDVPLRQPRRPRRTSRHRRWCCSAATTRSRPSRSASTSAPRSRGRRSSSSTRPVTART